MNKLHFTCIALMAGLLACGIFYGPNAYGQSHRLGDVNLDGTINILDIQQTIDQVLLVLPETYEADLDENETVDILDVQNMINTVLGEGGLIQRVSGTLVCDDLCTGLYVLGVSIDGRTARADVDPDTGEFLLRLRVKTAWSLALMETTDNKDLSLAELVGTFDFPVGNAFSCTLPIPDLARVGRPPTW